MSMTRKTRTVRGGGQEMAAATAEEPILSRIDRLDTILRQLEEMRGINSRSPKSSCASTPTSGTLTSDDLSPKSLEKHCRPINNVVMETEIKGSLVERLDLMEDRLLKVCLKMEVELEAEKRREKRSKKGLKDLLGVCVKGREIKHEPRMK